MKNGAFRPTEKDKGIYSDTGQFLLFPSMVKEYPWCMLPPSCLSYSKIISHKFNSTWTEPIRCGGAGPSRRIAALRPLARVEHVRRYVVLVASVQEFGAVVLGEPAVHALCAAADASALADHRHRAALYLQECGQGILTGNSFHHAHLLMQELACKAVRGQVKFSFRVGVFFSLLLFNLVSSNVIGFALGEAQVQTTCEDLELQRCHPGRLQKSKKSPQIHFSTIGQVATDPEGHGSSAIGPGCLGCRSPSGLSGRAPGSCSGAAGPPS